jgi:predicted dehydrogenase
MTNSTIVLRSLAPLGVIASLALAGCATADAGTQDTRVRLMTLDPGHFHAALVQKVMYPDVDSVVHVYAPGGNDLNLHLQRIQSFNARAEDPTRWDVRVHTGPDFFDRMIEERPGNVVVISGNNARKTEYIVRSVEAGLNVLADKPMARLPGDVARLEQAFRTAEQNGVLLYDIMTERYEVNSRLQRELSRNRALFGELQPGTPENPSMVKESVHHISKTVAGAPLIRPPWFFDVEQQGEGIVDVTTHLVDLVQWQAFPGVALSPDDATVLSARRWTTPVSLQQFAHVTGATEFPDYLRTDVRDGVAHVYSNGEFTYTLRGIHSRVSVQWNWEAPAGAGDTHYSLMRGTSADLVIRQGAEQNYRPELYVEPAPGVALESLETALAVALQALQGEYPGVGYVQDGSAWRLTIPAALRIGHEAHFGKVTEAFLGYLREGRLPHWEVPNMITKYSTIMQAYEMSR